MRSSHVFGWMFRSAEGPSWRRCNTTPSNGCAHFSWNSSSRAWLRGFQGCRRPKLNAEMQNAKCKMSNATCPGRRHYAFCILHCALCILHCSGLDIRSPPAQHLQPNARPTILDKAQFLRGAARDVDDDAISSGPSRWATVQDLKLNRASILQVRHSNDGTERIAGVGGHHRVHVELGAAGGSLALKIRPVI